MDPQQNNNDNATPPTTQSPPPQTPPAPLPPSPSTPVPPTTPAQPSAGLPPSPMPSSTPPKSNRALMVVIVLLVIVLIGGAVWAWMLIAPKSNTNGGSSGGSQNKNSASAPSETYQTYSNDQFHISFKYPASWGTVTMTQTTGTQRGATGVASYDATFSNKSGGSNILGDANPYLFRINSFKWGVTNSPIQTSQAYRTVGSDGSNNEVSAGLSVCSRIDYDGEQCDLFSHIGDWQTINHIILAKQTSGGYGVGLFAPLAANTGENYTMASFYSTSGDDYNAFQKIAESFTGQLQQ